MINNQKFNLGKFNIENGTKSLSGMIMAVSDTRAVMGVRFSAAGVMAALSGYELKEMARITPFSGIVEDSAESAVTVKFYRRRELDASKAPAESSMTTVTAAIFDVDAVTFPELSLPPGGELVIDTGEMTVTMNGENAIHLMSAESEFPLLFPGENEIIYTDDCETHDVNIKIMWKDRWL